MDTKKSSFFLPNFCAVQPVFILSVGAQLIAFVLILATGDIISESWDELGLLSIFVQWIALASAGLLCLTRKWLAKMSLFWSAVTAYLMIMGTTALISAAAQYLLIKIHYQWSNAPEITGQFVIRSVMISAIMALVALRYFYVQQQWKERIELESQARVDALQARIRPHFLFNSMNIIASLIHSQPIKAEQAVEDLSDLFRATLQDKGSMVTFEEEWALCCNYLRIEGLRLGSRLAMEVDVEKIPKDASIPMLTLQPLVENAIYHGIQPLEQGGTIKVKGDMQGNIIRLHLSNPISPAPPPKITEGNKMALTNIRHRLNLLFGSTAKLDLNVKPDYFEVVVIFPYVKGRL